MKKQILIRKNYLRFPIHHTAKKKSIEFFSGTKKVMHLITAMLPADSEEEPDFYGELSVKDFNGKKLTMIIEPVEETAENFCEDYDIVQSDELISDYGKELYPYAHFAPKCGWLNDPNGLVRYNGDYHLFYQHHAYGTVWEEISWGHAVSKDLIHWTHLPEAIMPDEHGTIFSGSAIINKVHMVENAEGDTEKICCPACPEDSLMLFYTNAGQKGAWSREGKDTFDQRIAFSTDGVNFTKIEGAVLEYMIHENRDPKVYWNEEAGNYYMVLFLDEHDYAIFVSKDLLHWEQTQVITIPESWECPDLVKLPVYDRSGNAVGEKWLFWTPDSYYLVGDFDGSIFTATQKTGKLTGNSHNDRKAYAAQSFNETPGRHIHIPWIFSGEKEHLYNGMMGLPREMKLLLQDDGMVVLSEPLAKEVADCQTLAWNAKLSEAQERSYSWEFEGAVQVEIQDCGDADLHLMLGEIVIDWNKDEQKISISGLETHELKELTDMTVVVDRGIVEIECNRATTLFYTLGPDTIADALSIRGGKSVQVYRIL